MSKTQTHFEGNGAPKSVPNWGAGIIVPDKAGQILVITEVEPPSIGLISVPGGGFDPVRDGPVTEGASIWNTAMFECGEEAGANVQVIGAVAVYKIGSKLRAIALGETADEKVKRKIAENAERLGTAARFMDPAAIRAQIEAGNVRRPHMMENMLDRFERRQKIGRKAVEKLFVNSHKEEGLKKKQKQLFIGLRPVAA